MQCMQFVPCSAGGLAARHASWLATRFVAERPTSECCTGNPFHSRARLSEDRAVTCCTLGGSNGNLS